VRGFFELLEQGIVIVRSMELAARLERHELAALRDARIIQPSSPPGTSKHDAQEEISVPDLVRTLRALYGIDPRGLPTPGRLDVDHATIGWCGAGEEAREVVLVGRPRTGLFGVLCRGRRTLALVPAGRSLGEADRAKHGPAALVSAEALDEVLVVREGRVARRDIDAVQAPAATPARPSGPPVLPVAGAKRWNEVTIWLVDERTVRIDVGGRSHRRTHTDLGMGHAQSREPTRVWGMLVAFCEGHGSLETARFGGVAATKKLVSRLRSDLRAAFGLSQDPFHPYRRSEGWRARFVASAELPGA
jgi:hypothetical protein